MSYWLILGVAVFSSSSPWSCSLPESKTSRREGAHRVIQTALTMIRIDSLRRGASAQLRMMGAHVGGKVGDLRPSASVCLHWFGPEHVSSQRVQERAAGRVDGSDGACTNDVPA